MVKGRRKDSGAYMLASWHLSNSSKMLTLHLQFKTLKRNGGRDVERRDDEWGVGMKSLGTMIILGGDRDGKHNVEFGG